MSQILILVAAIGSLFLGVFVLVRLILQIRNGKIQLASNFAPVCWAYNRISFVRLIIFNLTISMFYFGVFVFCLLKLGLIQGAV